MLRMNFFALIFLFSLLPAPAMAETLVYWRFEEGVPGTALSQNAAIPDASGHGNDLRTFRQETAPRFGDRVPFPMVPRTERPNCGALDNSSAPGGGCLTRDLFCVHEGKGPGLNERELESWTIEASVLFKGEPGWERRWQGIVGRDGYNIPERPAVAEDERPAFALKKRADTQRISVETYTARGAEVCLQSSTLVQPEVWYHIAAISDGKRLSLYLRGPEDAGYVLQGTAPFEGALFNNRGCWTVGRACFSNIPADQCFGWIDEVRISDRALPVKKLLASPR